MRYEVVRQALRNGKPGIFQIQELRMSYECNLRFKCDFCYEKVSEDSCNQLCEKCIEVWMSIERLQEAMTRTASREWETVELETVRNVLFSICDDLGNISFWENLIETHLTNQKIKSLNTTILLRKPVRQPFVIWSHIIFAGNSASQ